MKFVYGQRASSIIYNFINSIDKKGYWLIPVNCCPIVPAVIYKSNHNFFFTDVSLETYGMDFEIIHEKIKSDDNIIGLIYVRPFGHVENLEYEFEKIKSYNNKFYIIDDRCLAIPDTSDYLSKFTDLEVYSTGRTKYIDLGYGGFAKIKNNNNYNDNINTSNLSDKLNIDEFFISGRLVSHSSYDSLLKSEWLPSLNFNKAKYFDDIKNYYDKISIHKKNLNYIYSSIIPSCFSIHNKFNNWRFNILVKNKNEILNILFENKLFASSHYKPVNYFFNDNESSKWTSLHNHIINLFNDFNYTEDMAFITAKIISKHGQQ